MEKPEIKMNFTLFGIIATLTFINCQFANKNSIVVPSPISMHNSISMTARQKENRDMRFSEADGNVVAQEERIGTLNLLHRMDGAYFSCRNSRFIMWEEHVNLDTCLSGVLSIPAPESIEITFHYEEPGLGRTSRGKNRVNLNFRRDSVITISRNSGRIPGSNQNSASNSTELQNQ